MRIFVYEHLTAMGIGRDSADPVHAMYREGLAMRDALAEDFRKLAGVEVVFAEQAHDLAIIIAPETEGVLLGLAKQFASTTLGPIPAAIALTSDKLALANHWREYGIRTPATTDREPTPCEAFPVVWKPRDGCGSTATFLLKDAFEVARAKASVGSSIAPRAAALGECGLPMEPSLPATHSGPMILQEFAPGLAASIAFLCGPIGNVPLIPAFQRLSSDGRFKYLGGELPLPAGLSERAVRLAARAIACVPGLKGYVGVDLILGDAADGSQDFAIEINPRLTTSYVGLRALAEFNIAEAMLRIARGAAPPEMRWKAVRVRFEPDGMVAPVDQV